MEVEQKVEVFLIQMKCDHCNFGFMKYTGQAFTQIKTMYEHKCDTCEKYMGYDNKYPLVNYKRID